jgi:hypothetical protein
MPSQIATPDSKFNAEVIEAATDLLISRNMRKTGCAT